MSVKEPVFAALGRYRLRTMIEADIDQVAEIERESFPTTWPRTAYSRELSNKLARYLVVVDPVREYQPPARRKRSLLNILHRDTPAGPPAEYVVGYVGVWLMVDEAHIVAIAVKEDYRGLGLGELLLAEAVQVALDNRQELVTLEVRRTNTVAQALYEKYRFLKVGVRKRYYSDNHEDAIIMSTPPIQSDSYLEHLAYLRERLEQRLRDDAELGC